MMDALMPTPPRCPTLALLRSTARDRAGPGHDMHPADATRSLFRRCRMPRSAGPRRTERAAIDLDGLVDHGSNREVLEHSLAARLTHLAPARRVGDEPGDGVREGRAVLGGHEEPGLTPDHDVPVAGHVGGDDGQARRHGLE